MSVTGKRYTYLLDDKQCFLLWSKLGSVAKVIKYLTHHGRINPKTKKPFTPQAIWASAYRYVLQNIEEAWKHFQYHDPELTREQFEIHLIEKAATVYKTSRRRYVSWLRENDFYDRYREIYGKFIPLKPIEPRDIDFGSE